MRTSGTRRLIGTTARAWPLLALLAAAAPRVSAADGEVAPVVVSAAQTADLALTIYTAFTEQGGWVGPGRQDVHFALVKDRRRFRVRPGTNWIRLTDVAATTEPTSVSFRSVEDPEALRVLEQSFRYDLISAASVLEHSVGKRARFRQTLPGGGRVLLDGVLLSPGTPVPAAGGTVPVTGKVIRTDGGIVLEPAGDVELDALPEGLIRRPELLWKLHARQGGEHAGEIAYFARGVSWRADYHATLAPDDDGFALDGWVTVDNRSGTSYTNAALKLVAGDVHRAQEPEGVFSQFRLRGAGMAGPAAMPDLQFVEESFFEYHLYTLQRRTDIADNETKQIQFLALPRARAKKVYLFDALSPDLPGEKIIPGARDSRLRPPGQGGGTITGKVHVALEARNDEASGLGVPLPRGRVSLYKPDRRSRPQFIGDDRIDHTPRDEKLRLLVGSAFDLTGTRRVVAWRVDPLDVTVEVSLRNAGARPVEVRVYEHLPAGAHIVESSLPHEEEDAFTVRFLVPVPARGEGKVSYRFVEGW
ncbi:MAG: hypothetical protein HY321_16130 [Armatimonadetes bacterium]|nr:hypothetical protein [Armatimonadota bacterium]